MKIHYVYLIGLSTLSTSTIALANPANEAAQASAISSPALLIAIGAAVIAILALLLVIMFMGKVKGLNQKMADLSEELKTIESKIKAKEIEIKNLDEAIENIEAVLDAIKAEHQKLLQDREHMSRNIEVEKNLSIQGKESAQLDQSKTDALHSEEVFVPPVSTRDLSSKSISSLPTEPSLVDNEAEKQRRELEQKQAEEQEKTLRAQQEQERLQREQEEREKQLEERKAKEVVMLDLLKQEITPFLDNPDRTGSYEKFKAIEAKYPEFEVQPVNSNLGAIENDRFDLVVITLKSPLVTKNGATQIIYLRSFTASTNETNKYFKLSQERNIGFRTISKMLTPAFCHFENNELIAKEYGVVEG